MKEPLRFTAGVGHSSDEKILALFRTRGEGVVSGEELSALLGVSRTAVWKQIKSLKELGYRIEAVPAAGYRLLAVPDLLMPAEIAAGLAAETIGRQIVTFRETESTNESAFRMAEEGAPEGMVVFAEAQSRGKGRLGRRWESPPGVNLYCSVVLRPPLLPVQAVQLTFLSAVAVARAIERTTPLRPTIKWPNDVLIDGRKVAGLLNEMSAETDTVNFVILGIGVNVNMERHQFPADLRQPATSLLLAGGEAVDRIAFARRLLAEVDELYTAFRRDGYGAVRQEWLARCAMIDRRVRVTMSGGSMEGVVTGIDEYGALLLRADRGGVERVLAGDVQVLD